jgi:hypothetical protein
MTECSRPVIPATQGIVVQANPVIKKSPISKINNAKRANKMSA